MNLPTRLLSDTARMPVRAHEDDAAFDLCANESLAIEPGGRAMVATGVALELPPGACGLVLPRSGLAASHGITVLNAPGLIDSGYRGEVKVVLANTDPTKPFQVTAGERIAQLMVMRTSDVALTLADRELSVSTRGDGGFGSTGR